VSRLTPVAAAVTDQTNIQNFFRTELVKTSQMSTEAKMVSPSPAIGVNRCYGLPLII